MDHLAAHQGAAVAELVEWWEDLHDCSTGSRLVRLVVPPGWGRSTVLEALADRVAADESRMGTVLWLKGGQAPDGLALQIAWLHDHLQTQGFLPPLRTALGLDRSEGVAETALGTLGLLGLVTGVAGLPASLALKAITAARDRSEAGMLAQPARLGGALASYSTRLPVALLIDDAELVDPRLVERLAFSVLDRLKSNVLAVVTVAPNSPLLKQLAPSERFGPRWERIGSVDVAAAMDQSARRRLIEATTAETTWPSAAVDRLAARTRSFADVWAVLDHSAADDLWRADSLDEQFRLVDALTGEVIDPGVPPLAARVLALAGGLMHERQLTSAVSALGTGDAEEDGGGGRWLSHLDHAVRFANPTYRTRAERSASVLSQSQRSAIASAVTLVAGDLCASPTSNVSTVELVSALRAVLHLAEQGVLPGTGIAKLLVRLTDELERLGDISDALRIAKVVVGLVDAQDLSDAVVADRLAATVLRLGRVCEDMDAADGAAEWAEAIEAGAIVGLEVSTWTAISLLDRPATRPAGARILDSLVEELTGKDERLGDAGQEWRLLLAFHAGRAGYLTLAEQLLSPLLTRGDQSDQAYQVLAAVSGAGGADLRLFRTELLARYRELEAQSDPSERLAVVDALADVASRLGAFADALRYGQEKLDARLRLFHRDHPDTLWSRHDVALWTGELGDARAALALYESLLPDVTRVLGPDHPCTLSSRHNLAVWTGVGDARAALALVESLLPDVTRVLGPDHLYTLSSRHNLAVWTGVGDARAALALVEALLPDVTEVLGPDHLYTLSTRHSLASLTEKVGDPRAALSLLEALLPDRNGVLGPEHPDTLATSKAIERLRHDSR